MIKLKNYSNVKNNLRFYSGNAGQKLGFTDEHGDNWFLKFPKSTKNFEKVEISYTTSPLSEYIGSKIYQEIGIPVHETEIGIFDKKVVVACKDFLKDDERLYEAKELFNLYLGDKESKREALSSSDSSYQVDIEELTYLFKENKIINSNEEIENRFWDMFVVDSFLNNNDRHNGNWGITIDSLKNIKLAPVYDNGNSFFNKHDDGKFENNFDKIDVLITNGRTPFIFNNKQVDSVKVIKNLSFGDNNLNFSDKESDAFLKETSFKLRQALKRVVIKIDIEKINKLIDEIPEEKEGIKIISQTMKEFYKNFINKKYEIFLLPALNKIIEHEQNDRKLI
ncbi:MAG: HipA domain-containing protein [Fusobacteriaceae bacterium]